MSQEDAKRLIEHMNTDEAFRAMVLAAPDVGERLRLATAEGYDVTAEEIESASAMLSDAELHTVTGAGGGVGRGTAQDLIEYDGLNYCQCRY